MISYLYVSDIDVLFSKLELELYVIVQLCQRNSGKMDKTAREVNMSFSFAEGDKCKVLDIMRFPKIRLNLQNVQVDKNNSHGTSHECFKEKSASKKTVFQSK